MLTLIVAFTGRRVGGGGEGTTWVGLVGVPEGGCANAGFQTGIVGSYDGEGQDTLEMESGGGGLGVDQWHGLVGCLGDGVDDLVGLFGDGAVGGSNEAKVLHAHLEGGVAVEPGFSALAGGGGSPAEKRHRIRGGARDVVGGRATGRWSGQGWWE